MCRGDKEASALRPSIRFYRGELKEIRVFLLQEIKGDQHNVVDF
jgi:hypothetical protein